MVSAWTSSPTYLMVFFVGDEFIGHSLLFDRRSDSSVHNLLALDPASAEFNPRCTGSSPTLDRTPSSHRV